MASNNWVIHGKHTSTGMPILASDPHLPNQIPSVWTLNELVWGENRLTGATMPGIPLIGIGKGKQISFGQTTPRTDTSDLWQEKIDEEGLKYFLDGEWKDLDIVD